LSDTSLSPLGSLRTFVGEVRDEMARTDCRSGCLVGKLAQEVNTLPENFREQLSAVFAEWQAVFARGLKRAQETGEISPELDCASTAAFFWYGWEGALQRANLELNIKPVDIFIGNFFSRLTG
ncbi:MAG: TetR family transcriptional regulator C-terminal domain-containing protein, partial [Bilophila wadsworthia]